MKIYEKGNSHLFCGHWNGSPVEIGITDILMATPSTEILHYHEYYEYYVVLHGYGKMNVDGKEIELNPNSVVMIEPHEKHEITWVDPIHGIQWVIIKQHSIPDSKQIVSV